jgi:hypothetical protein
LDFYQPGRKRPIEIDVCVIMGGQLWIGEARTASSLGANEKDARNKLRRLREAAAVLNVSGILLVSEQGFAETAKSVIREVFPLSERPNIRIESSPAPVAARD